LHFLAKRARFCHLSETENTLFSIYLLQKLSFSARDFYAGQGAPRHRGDGVVTYSEPSIAGATQYGEKMSDEIKV
jgi:hypothetical protein